MPMIRLPELSRPCLALMASLGAALAQDAAQPAPEGELGHLKAAIENQSRQIEALTKQVTELNQRLSAQKPAQPSSDAPQPATAPQSQPAATPEAQPAPTAAASPDSGLKHTVAKGETLTSIAKRYNIPLTALEKANKIENDRMLQIGRVLSIPLPANKTSEPPKEQKENP